MNYDFCLNKLLITSYLGVVCEKIVKFSYGAG